MTALSKEDVRNILPQSDPLLLVDTATVDIGNSAQSTCYIDPQWDVFRGHFAGEPVMPGIYITESMAQTADLAILTVPGRENMLPLFLGISQMRFLRPVYPGDTLECHASVVYDGGSANMYEFAVSATCDGKKIASGKLSIALKACK